jgi:hypothetical protein
MAIWPDLSPFSQFGFWSDPNAIAEHAVVGDLAALSYVTMGAKHTILEDCFLSDF